MAFRPPGFGLKFINRFSNRKEEHNAWETFVTQHKLLPDVQPHIGRSWLRCWSLLDPNQAPTPNRLTSDHLLSTQVANFELLLIARPVMEDIFQYIEGTETAVVIVNSAGYILDMLGDQEILKEIGEIGIVQGYSLTENHIGTNAFALAIAERMPMQVSGSEHYLAKLHDLAESASPIFDLNGNPMGAIGMINFQATHHPHSLGLVVAGARAIEGQRQADHLLFEQNQQLGGLNAILSSIDEGILMWNTEGIIIHANRAANRVLQIEQEALTGKKISEFLRFPSFVQAALRDRKPLSNIEANLEAYGRRAACVISLRYITTGRGISGCVVILRSTQEVRKLVHSQVGAQATLSLDNLIGDSTQMRRVRRAAETAAAARASILIRGESGTGKNLLARAIHNHSPQREGPFLLFACNAIPSELIISELEGVDITASAGKTVSRPGKFELADGGTIFMKDVEALPLEAQTILLNVLELGIVQRVGSRTPIPIQVRVIASTSADLEKLVSEGSFRSDLYYRLSPFEIQLPALREHMEDLPLLVESILERINRFQKNPISVAPETLAALRSYRWPGNVRELEGVLERAYAQADQSPLLQTEHLPENVRKPEFYNRVLLDVPSLNEVEEQAILRAARVCNGNLSQMARLLGIGRTTVWRRIKDLEIPIEQFRDH